MRREHDPRGFVMAASRLGFVSFLVGDADRAVKLCNDAIDESNRHGESWHKAEALSYLSIVLWRQTDTLRASELAAEGLRIQRTFDNAVGMAQFLEVLAWIAATERRYPRAARLLGAADGVWHAIDAALFPYLHGYRAETEMATRRALGARAFETDYRLGLKSLHADNVAFALDEPESALQLESGAVGALSRREREIADLVANGLSNKEIATKLVISRRTAEGHVEHIFGKLGFTSRAQIATWVAEHRDSSSATRDQSRS
jgi:DNA-binding NarL/FixJ family response regulator